MAPIAQVNATIGAPAPSSIPSQGEVTVMILVSSLESFTSAYDLETWIGLLLNPVDRDRS